MKTRNDTGFWQKDGEKNLKLLREMISRGASWEEITKKFGKTRGTIESAMKRCGIKKPLRHQWFAEQRELVIEYFKKSQAHSRYVTEEKRELERFQQELLEKVNRIARAHNRGEKSWNAVIVEAGRLSTKLQTDGKRKERLLWGSKQKTDSRSAGPTQGTVSPLNNDELAEFLSVRRSAKAIAERLGVSEEKVEEILPRTIDGKELISFRNQSGARVYLYFQKPEHASKAERVFTVEHQEDDSCIIVRFRDDLDLRSIRLVHLAEADFGAELHDAERFNRYCDLLIKDPQTFATINGSIFPNPPRVSPDEKIQIMFDWVNALVRRLEPAAHKILWALEGCTEERMRRFFDFSPLEEACKVMNIAHFRRPVNAEIVFGKHNFSFFCIHGDTRAEKRGTKLNAAFNLLETLGPIDFLVMSHQQAGMEKVVPRHIRDRARRRIKTQSTHIILTPNFKKFEGSPEERRGKAPPPVGSYACILYPSGLCGTSE